MHFLSKFTPHAILSRPARPRGHFPHHRNFLMKFLPLFRRQNAVDLRRHLPDNLVRLRPRLAKMLAQLFFIFSDDLLHRPALRLTQIEPGFKLFQHEAVRPARLVRHSRPQRRRTAKLAQHERAGKNTGGKGQHKSRNDKKFLFHNLSFHIVLVHSQLPHHLLQLLVVCCKQKARLRHFRQQGHLGLGRRGGFLAQQYKQCH